MPNGLVTGDGEDRNGFDDTGSTVADAVGKFVPQAVARWALSVDVETDRERYAPGEPVELTVTVRNRLPVPVAVTTPRRRLWGWSVDGERDASDERVHESDTPGVFAFRATERKVLRHRWNGRFKRTRGERTRWVDPDPGVHEVRAFVAVADPRPSDAVEVEIRPE